MFCEYCRSLIEESDLACATCGRERAVSVRLQRAAGAELVTPLAIEPPAGPSCEEHAGMPLLGACPRCGRRVCVRCAPEAIHDVLTCTGCAGLTDKHLRVAGDALCALHPDRRAGFCCSRCGSFACAGCAATTPGAEGLCLRCAPAFNQPLASRGARFLANLIDSAAILIPVAVVAANASPESEPVVVLASFLIPGAVQIAAQLRWGQSLGKRALGIRVVTVDGAPIALWRLLLLRNLLPGVLAQLCGLVGLVDALMIFGNEQRCMHDYVAGTRVVEVSRDAP